jgi:hypothetical protein
MSIPGMEWVLELALIALLGATLFHAVRLERALGVLKRDRATLEALVAGFNTSTRQAESGVERLRAAADGAGRQIARQIEAATSLKDDLGFLIERGERAADRLDAAVRSARPSAMEVPRPQAAEAPRPQAAEAPRPQAAEAPRPRAMEAPRPRAMEAVTRQGMEAVTQQGMDRGRQMATAEAEAPDMPRVRSQAERDLLKALRMAR